MEKKSWIEYSNFWFFIMKTNKVIYITSNIIITIVKYDHLLKFNVDENGKFWKYWFIKIENEKILEGIVKFLSNMILLIYLVNLCLDLVILMMSYFLKLDIMMMSYFLKSDII